ncbi:hypothetical protein GCM10009872_54170 [Actinopolymorpha rutila]
MFSGPPEDPAVAGVEEILDVAASIGSGAGRPLEARPIATHALWICACVTSSGDAPTWLIYDTDEGRIVWRRVQDRVAPLDLVDARLSAGGHADPAEVLRWLERKAPDPWARGGAGSGDAAVMEELGRKLRCP